MNWQAYILWDRISCEDVTCHESEGVPDETPYDGPFAFAVWAMLEKGMNLARPPVVVIEDEESKVTAEVTMFGEIE